jgi:hypothetical protein
MRKWFCLTAAAAVLVFAVAALASGPDFSGKWVLDKSKSEGLSGPGGRGIESITMTVTQTDKQLTIASKESREGGGGGMEQTFTYNLDGSETKADVGGRMQMKATLKAKPSASGLDLDQERTGNFNGNEFTMTYKEHWELGDGGKVLTIHRSMETPRGNRDMTLVFNKQ